MKKRSFAGLIVGVSLAFSVPVANGAQIFTDFTNTVVVPGISDFQTTGADMAGMTVIMDFGTSVDAAVWQIIDPVAGSGGASGAGWSITQSGDTFGGPWTVTIDPSLLLLGMAIDASTGLTVFDRTDDSGFAGQGTPGTFSGLDFMTSLAGDDDVIALYANAVAVGAPPPVGDIWHLLFVDFRALDGVSGQFTFIQDTDNDIRARQVPEPATLGLFGLGLAGLGFALRRRRLR